MPYGIKDTSYEFPLLEEINLNKFVKLQTCKTDLQKLGVLMDCDLSEISSRPDALQCFSGLIKLLDTLNKEITEFLKSPPKEDNHEVLMIMATPIDAKHINKTKRSIWEQMTLAGIIKRMGKEPFNCYEQYNTLIGCYTYTMVTGDPYRESEVKEYTREIIGNLPFQEAIRMGDLFLYTERHHWNNKKASKHLSFKVKEAWIKARFPIYNAN
jgi:hypothetical protein